MLQRDPQARALHRRLFHNGEDVPPPPAHDIFRRRGAGHHAGGTRRVELLRQPRSQGNHTPVLLLSAHAEVKERVEGLNAGVEHYLPKRFALLKMLAQGRSLARRSGEARPPSHTPHSLSANYMPQAQTQQPRGRRIFSALVRACRGCLQV